jgi:GT2 family glycosyltransferase
VAAAQTGFTVINFNTARQTVRCVESLLACAPPPAWVMVLDNASEAADLDYLARHLAGGRHTEVRLYRSDRNFGFAAGSNFLIDCLLAEPVCRYVGLLNNDAVAEPCLLDELLGALERDGGAAGMAGGRVHRLLSPNEVDTLGISLYRSLMPADRRDLKDAYLGPTGGCCVMTRDLVDDLRLSTGYVFDERFFCYCEDTDLVLRANLLGYRPAYTDALVALHEGQASSGSGYNAFIAYHGLRNAFWMHVKLVPTSWFVRYGPFLALAHLLSVVRHTFAGHPGLMFRVYRDALRQLPAFWRERGELRRVWRVAAAQLRGRITGRYYRQGYWRLVVSQLRRRHGAAPGTRP